jgi:prophage maintenance system killer protein
MASNHGFADGNKRTTLILLHTFLTKSGYRLVALEDDQSLERAAEEMILDTVNHVLAYDDLCVWFKSRIQRIQSS